MRRLLQSCREEKQGLHSQASQVHFFIKLEIRRALERSLRIARVGHNQRGRELGVIRRHFDYDTVPGCPRQLTELTDTSNFSADADQAQLAPRCITKMAD